ncbi:MAG: methylmalonyl-CoA epimerase [Candidatus Eisenbacteria bacterium]
MKVVRVDHVGIAMKEIGAIAPLLRVLFGGEEPRVEVVPDQGVRTTAHRAGETSLEFLEGTGADGPVDRFLARRGSALHHIALAVEDLETALAELKKAGIPLIDEAPRRGAEGKRIAFLHPKGAGGILIELCEAGPRSRE